MKGGVVNIRCVGTAKQDFYDFLICSLHKFSCVGKKEKKIFLLILHEVDNLICVDMTIHLLPWLVDMSNSRIFSLGSHRTMCWVYLPGECNDMIHSGV